MLQREKTNNIYKSEIKSTNHPIDSPKIPTEASLNAAYTPSIPPNLPSPPSPSSPSVFPSLLRIVGTGHYCPQSNHVLNCVPLPPPGYALVQLRPQFPPAPARTLAHTHNNPAVAVEHADVVLQGSDVGVGCGGVGERMLGMASIHR